MATPDPVRTGDDDVDFASGLYKPLRRNLGDEQFQRIADAVANAIKAGGTRTPDQIAADAVQAMDNVMGDLACAYNRATHQWQWYNPSTGEWDGPC